MITLDLTEKKNVLCFLEALLNNAGFAKAYSSEK